MGALTIDFVVSECACIDLLRVSTCRCVVGGWESGWVGEWMGMSGSRAGGRAAGEWVLCVLRWEHTLVRYRTRACECASARPLPALLDRGRVDQHLSVHHALIFGALDRRASVR